VKAPLFLLVSLIVSAPHCTRSGGAGPSVAAPSSANARTAAPSAEPSGPSIAQRAHDSAPAPSASPIAVVFGTPLVAPPAPLAEATFAGGCFWCTESTFEGVRGVRAVISGYTGGPEERPTYEQVCDHATGHAEAVRVLFDPREVTYGQLLAVFWRVHDPTTPDRSFHDAGHQYRSAIFYHSPAQRAEAEASRRELENQHKYNRPIVTGPYHAYREGSGRDAYIVETWGEGALARAQRH
jgi:peptide-methionine (S)-S-oxide reductase